VNSKFQGPSFKLKATSIIFILFGLLIVACNSGTKKAETTNNSDESGVAKFVFSEEIHNFGSLKAGELVSFTFVFKNEGTKTLTITDLIKRWIRDRKVKLKSFTTRPERSEDN